MHSTSAHMKPHDRRHRAVLMPHVLCASSTTKNAKRLVACFPSEPGRGLRCDLLTTLNTLNQRRIYFDAGKDGPALLFSEGEGLDTEALRELMANDTLPPDWEFSADEAAAIRERTSRAIAMLRNVLPDDARAFSLLVGTILFGRQRSYGGGSLSSVVGAMCMSPEPAWSTAEYAANLLHEYVHQCLFLDDMVNRIFTVNGTQLKEESASITSSILKVKRPYDRAFHSAFVLFALLQYAHLVGQPQLAPGTVRDAWTTTQQLLEKPHLLTDHGTHLVTSLAESLSDFDNDPTSTRRASVC